LRLRIGLLQLYGFLRFNHSLGLLAVGKRADQS
jgi:hypothetical protein